MKKLVTEELQRKNNMSRVEASDSVDAVFGAVKSVLEQGDRVSIPNFGTFRRDFQDTRKGKNPRTGEEITIQGRHKIKFTERRVRNR